jgi:transcriptional antiterminator NusG
MAKWYIVNVVAGQENNICDEINKLAVTFPDVKEAFLPTKKIFKHVRGKKVESAQKLYPNYVFVNMEMNKESNALIRGIGKVLNFLGSKTRPEEVSDAKMDSIKKKVEQENSTSADNVYEVGDTVKITEGAFESFTGTVEARDLEKNTLKISVSIFGRPTVVDIESNKVERV